jgi:fatty acid-binding protein DegV
MLDVDVQGKLRACHKKRGRRKALDGLIEWMREFTESDRLEIFAVSHADCEEDADYILRKVKSEYKVANIMKGEIGPVIGSHSGPGTIAIFFVGKPRG